MSDSLTWQRWRYYFFDLSLWAAGIRTVRLERRLFSFFQTEAPAIKNGIIKLYDFLKRSVSDSEVEGIVQKTFLVKVVRESDAYSCLGMSRKRFSKYFETQGIEHLLSAREQKRPIVLLTGHYGSFFIPAIAFSHMGFDVYPIARTVDNSPATPLATRIYLTLNYRFSERRFPAGYIYTDFAGWIDRKVVSVLNTGGILWTAIDFPERLYPHKRLPVRLLGLSSSLPSGIVRSALKRGAVFLTAWNSVESMDGRNWYRSLTIDEPIVGKPTVEHILQTYADRLTERISNQPWQWMGLPIVSQYDESGTGKTEDI